MHAMGLSGRDESVVKGGVGEKKGARPQLSDQGKHTDSTEGGIMISRNGQQHFKHLYTYQIVGCRGGNGLGRPAATCVGEERGQERPGLIKRWRHGCLCFVVISYLCIASGVLCCVVPVMVRAAPVDVWVSIWSELSDHQADATGIYVLRYLV